MSSQLSHQQIVLRLYRSIIKEALKLPLQNRRDWVRNKARWEFKQAKSEIDAEKVDFLVRLGETQLESLQVQAAHLSSLYQPEPKKKFLDIKYTVPVFLTNNPKKK